DRALPDTVLAMVETRLARLAVEARRVLRAASVFGEVCWEGGVAVLLDGAMTAATVAEWISRLAEQEVLMIRPHSRVPGERELAFRHALLREGTYASLTDDDKRLGHRLAGDWLERHGEGDPMVLAGHFERGGDGARAAAHYLRAAEQAFHVFDLDATMARAALGLACAPPPELRNALLGLRCEVSGQGWKLLGDTMADAEELTRSAAPGSVPWAQGMLAYNQGLMVAGRIPDLVASIDRLRAVDAAPDAIGRMALALLSAICMLDALGQIASATPLERQFAALLGDQPEREPVAHFWWNILIGMRATYAHDDVWTALRHSDAIQPIYDVLSTERIFLNMQLFRGMNRWLVGAFDTAAPMLEAIAAADVSLGVASSLRRLTLAWLLADQGELARARGVAAELADYGRAHGYAIDEGRGRWALAEVLRRTGDLDTADREIQVALALAVPLERPGVLATLSALRLAQGRTQDAVAAAEDAIAQCTAMGGCGMFRGAFVRLARAEALHASGAHTAARHAISEARERLRAIARRIGDPDHRHSFLYRVPEHARTLALARNWLGELASRS
ncbi:MAG TPA: hypothetical protein VHW23_07890, partial [Kofleriaceae bacterium]|nr:hypothetical protein [Kofleriaceae bacterium]